MSPPVAQQIISSMRIIMGEDGTDEGKRYHWWERDKQRHWRNTETLHPVVLSWYTIASLISASVLQANSRQLTLLIILVQLLASWSNEALPPSLWVSPPPILQKAAHVSVSQPCTPKKCSIRCVLVHPCSRINSLTNLIVWWIFFRPFKLWTKLEIYYA